MKNLLIAIIIINIDFGVSAQTVILDEGFQNGIPATWSVIDADGQTPDSSISFVNEGWVRYESVFDTCAISTSYYSGSSDQSQDYLISPKLNLLSFGHILTWESKSFDANYLETYYVLLSTADSLPSSFTDTIMIVTDDSPNWKTFSTNLFLDGFANQSIYIAFQNASTDEYILGVDNVKLTTNDIASVSKIPEKTISVFPNPVVDQLNVSVPDGSKYELIGFEGKIIKEGTIESGLVDLSQLKSSIYFLKIQIDNEIYTKKIVKL
ncbi:MAG: choice-of-anchor J domain-containing protein [Crocinitomicaceae bacterium]